MRRCKKLRPYVRRANGKEKACSFRDAIRLAVFANLHKPYYVMVQHGEPNTAIAVGRSKREVQSSPAHVAFGIKSFRQWSRDVQRIATKR